jgi:hypothetical protein
MGAKDSYLLAILGVIGSLWNPSTTMANLEADLKNLDHVRKIV